MRRLAVFARAPVAGRVKSRLSPALPAPLAAAIYAGLLADTFAAARAGCADECYVYWADDSGPTPEGFRARTQAGEDLGERMRHAFDELLVMGAGREADRVLVLGSDTPALTSSHLAAAFHALEQHDVVLGPTPDGGYWCIGLKRPASALFRDMPWSTSGVLAHTLERARVAGLNVAQVATLPDLDTPHDLACLVGALARRATACGALAQAALRGMGMLPAPRA